MTPPPAAALALTTARLTALTLTMSSLTEMDALVVVPLQVAISVAVPTVCARSRGRDGGRAMSSEATAGVIWRNPLLSVTSISTSELSRATTTGRADS